VGQNNEEIDKLCLKRMEEVVKILDSR